MNERRNGAKWNLRAAVLAEFVAEHGRLPRRTQQDKSERQLTVWLATQRTAELSAERAAALDAISPIWRRGTLPSMWVERVEEIVTFVSVHGHRPRAQGPTPEERRMGFWLTRQRRAERDGKLAPEAEAMLSGAIPGWEAVDRPERIPRPPRPKRMPNPPRERHQRPVSTNDLIERAQRDVTNRYPVLHMDDPLEFSRLVVRRYLRLSERFASTTPSTDNLEAVASTKQLGS
jgi:hypothetical protein